MKGLEVVFCCSSDSCLSTVGEVEEARRRVSGGFVVEDGGHDLVEVKGGGGWVEIGW